MKKKENENKDKTKNQRSNRALQKKISDTIIKR